MNLYINDLSYNPNNTSSIEPLLKDFLDVCERVQQYSFEKLIVPSDYHNREIIQGISFANCFHTINNSSTGKLILSRIKSLMANQFYSTQDTINQDLHWIEWNRQPSDFLTKSYNHETPVISFKTHQPFEHHSIDVFKIELDANANAVNANVSIFNLSDLDHFRIHNAFLNNKQQAQLQLNGQWNPLQDPLRFIQRIHQYLENINYYEKIQHISENERISIYRSVGKHIAEINGWKENKSISKKNSRDIFKALNKSAYLAIDTMHGSFELHDRQGKHQGEYNFKGEKIDNADTKGKHDITL